MVNFEVIKKFHKTSFNGLWILLKERGTLRKGPFKLSLLIALLIFGYFMYKGTKASFDSLEMTLELILSFFPNLLGFSLGGFAIVVGFTNTDLIKESTEEDTYSVYQLLNSIFALCIITQVFIVVIAYLVSWTIKSNILNASIEFDALPTFANSILLLILNFGAIYSLLLTPYIVINLFTLSQTNNLFYTLSKIKEKGNSNKQDAK